MINSYHCSLGNLLKLERRPVKVKADEQYREIGVYSFGRGIFHKEPKLGLEVGEKDLFLIREGDFILQITFAWEGAVGLASEAEDGLYGSIRFPTFRVDEKQCYSPYLINYFRTPQGRDQLMKISPGSAGRNRVLSLKRIPEIFVPLPSLEEQHRIVARIEELAARIEEARGLRREAVEGSKRLIVSAVTQILKAIASEAKQVTIESIAYSVTDGDHQPPPKADSGIPFIFINHIVGGNIDFSDCKWVPPEYFTSLPANRIPKRGDVLYTAVGSYGVPCLVDIDEPFCFQRHIAIIKPNQNLIVPAYLKWALSSSDVFDQATKVATGSAQLTVPLRGIRNLQFPLPSLDEQERVITYLDSLRSKLNSLKQLQSETSAELDALLPSILDKAFKGDL